MNKKAQLSWILFIAAVLLIGFLIFRAVYNHSANSTSVTGTGSAIADSQSNTNQSQVRFSDTAYFQYAHLISGDTIDDQTKQALAGFELIKSNLSDGSLNITLNAINPEYQNQNYIVKPGEKLYFVETSFGDDSTNGEYNLGDDGAVLVNSDGYIVN